MNSFERQEHRSEPISTWQARDQQVAGLTFLQKKQTAWCQVLALSTDACLDTTIMKPNVVLSCFGRDHAQRSLAFLSLATLETRRKLGRVSFRMDFWDRYCGRAGQHLATISLSLLTDPETFAKVISAQSPSRF